MVGHVMMLEMTEGIGKEGGRSKIDLAKWT